MQFFTQYLWDHPTARGWAEASALYRAHLQSMAGSIPVHIMSLGASYFHDCELEAVERSASDLRLTLRGFSHSRLGDGEQTGTHLMHFKGVSHCTFDTSDLGSWWGYEELRRMASGYEYRVLFPSRRREVIVEFGDVSVATSTEDGD